jgi:hypothetical protein
MISAQSSEAAAYLQSLMRGSKLLNAQDHFVVLGAQLGVVALQRARQ